MTKGQLVSAAERVRLVAFHLRRSVPARLLGPIQGQAGAEVPSANRITLLRDRDGDGVAEIRSTFLKGLNSPFGMTLLDGKLYVANTDAIVAFPYQDGTTQIKAEPEKIVDLPSGSINHHWTKDVIASRDGTKLYATVGSKSNVGENGMENEENRAAVMVDLPDPDSPTIATVRPRGAARRRRLDPRGQYDGYRTQLIIDRDGACAFTRNGGLFVDPVSGGLWLSGSLRGNGHGLRSGFRLAA